jgi:hypothetical protein
MHFVATLCHSAGGELGHVTSQHTLLKLGHTQLCSVKNTQRDSCESQQQRLNVILKENTSKISEKYRAGSEDNWYFSQVYGKTSHSRAPPCSLEVSHSSKEN